MDTWEYVVKVFNDRDLQDQLNNHGQYGYELVQVEHFKPTNTWCVFMKKKLKS